MDSTAIYRPSVTMKKADKIEKMLGDLAAEQPGEKLAVHPCYAGYFTCFNQQRYYEAHDVLEHLWLQGAGDNYAFFKGLIQLAGAFVHLQKQFIRPHHPKDRNRTHPAVRLFHLAVKNLEGYRPRHLHLDVDHVCTLGTGYAEQIIAADFANPWSPATAPILALLALDI